MLGLVRPLDESLYNKYTLDTKSVAFIKSQTGIKDADGLKEHLLDVQRRAYKLHGFPCIRAFSFAMTKIADRPAYQRVLGLGRQREDAILLDLGCCLGTDVRKAASDGFPVQNIIANDLFADYWQYGHELFKSTPASFPATFLAGDVFDNGFIQPAEPWLSAPPSGRPSLDTLTSLTPLNGHVSAIHAAYLFHIFDKSTQLALARTLAGLLSPLPGSVIFGAHIGEEHEGYVHQPQLSSGKMFCHCPESWTRLWQSIFPPGTVQVEAKLNKNDPNYVSSRASDDEDLVIVWSVTRL
ncbi:hypothetical protein C8J57DRAFT_366825 [Mycena rebaudengoi]|nr:hypothetical protein C8J57DRAFT_366825 [Mycena rebaudengoi]